MSDFFFCFRVNGSTAYTLSMPCLFQLKVFQTAGWNYGTLAKTTTCKVGIPYLTTIQVVVTLISMQHPVDVPGRAADNNSSTWVPAALSWGPG